MNPGNNIDFFDEEYSREVCSRPEFGICDGDNEQNQPSYLSLEAENKTDWGAVVKNKKGKTTHFLPVDNNIPMLKSDGNQEKRCDGILYILEEKEKSIHFIELKERTDKQSKTWRKDGIKQLISTIDIFSMNHNIQDYKRRRAYVCNRKKPDYAYSNREELENFRKKYNVSLYIQPFIDIE